MSRKHRETMRRAGIDPNRYLSMRIDKDDIPDGAEVVISIRDRETGELKEVSVNAVDDDQFFGKHSQFYKQVMADGNIFNPYIHRRFLPAQFRRNVRIAGYNGIYDYVRRFYSWNYVVRFLKEECAKLAMLENRDREAFEERRAFFTLEDMKRIMAQYVQTVCDVLDREYARVKADKPLLRHDGPVYICPKGMSRIRLPHVRPMKHRFTMFSRDVENCGTYAEMSRLINGFDFAKLSADLPVSHTFAERFIESGAYYTFKQMIMFEGLSLGGSDVVENLKLMKERGRNGYMRLYRTLNV